MKINQLCCILISLILFLYNNKVIVSANDQDCLNSLLFNLFSVPSQSVVLCSDTEISNSQYIYKGTCFRGTQTLSDLYVASKSSDPYSSAYKLSYSDLGCFTNLTTLTLERLLVLSGFLGTADQTKTAENVFLNYCGYKDGVLVSGDSISKDTKSLVIKTDQYSGLTNIDLRVMLYQKNFELKVDNTVAFPVFQSTLDEGTLFMISLSSFKADIVSFPSFANFICDSVTLNIFGSTHELSASNLTSMKYINKLSLNYINDDLISFPSQLGTIKNLTISGNFKKPAAYLHFPTSLQEFYMFTDSVNFNIDGNFPFTEFNNTLKVISVGNLGLVAFPSNLPPSIESLKFDNNNFVSIGLPNLLNYTKLKRVSLINCGITQDITYRDDYCYFDALLNNNDLHGTQPQCMICYSSDTASRLTGNSNLNQGSCEKGSIVPNLFFDSSSNYLYLHGVNLGLKSPIVEDKHQFEFQLDQPQKQFKFDWPNILTLPKTISMRIGSSNSLFIVPTTQLLPTLSYIRKSGIDFVFGGIDFSYNASNYKVVIQDTKCYLLYIEYFSLSCSLKDGDLLPVNSRLPGTITNLISGQVLNFYMNNTIDTTTYFCPDCLNGDCNQNTGVCICNKGFMGTNCDQTSSILCSSDCGEGLGHGSCNTSVGECVCVQKWTGNSCSTPNQFLTSASSTFTNGGIVNLFGWLGTPNVGLTIKIGDLNCNNITHNETFASCKIEAGTGTKSITITQNGITYVAADIFHYNELTYKCPKDCSLNGVQNGECNKSTGECKCYTNWAGYDCNSRTDSPVTTTGGSGNPDIPISNTTINGTDGSTIISNQQTSYEISILSLVELDILDNVVLVHNLTNKWINNSTSTNNSSTNSNSNIYKFTQSIAESCSVVYTIEDVKEAREFTFAGLQLSLAKDTVKMTVTINNYPFTSTLNKLQLRLESKVGDDGSKECNSRETKIDSSQIDKNQLLNYITISRNEKILYGRYLNRVLSDTRESFITTTLITNSTSSNKDSFIIGLNLPFFTQSLTIDPDFSVLVSSDYQGKCKSSDRASWVLPVAIVVPCVVVAAIIIIASIIVKKNHTAILIIKNKLKSLSPKNQNLYMPNDNNANELNKL